MDQMLVQDYIETALSDESLNLDDRNYLLDIQEFISTNEPKSGDLYILEDLASDSGENLGFRRQQKSKKLDKTWRQELVLCIYKEFYLAFCKKDKRYQDEVNKLASNAKLIIAAIAGSLATVIGIKVILISAITATLLWLILKIGLNSFCQFYSTRLEVD